MSDNSTAMKLGQYEPIVGRQCIDELRLLARMIKARRISEINSTKNGGGVAELLSSLVPLLQDLGFEVDWVTIDGDENFFDVTKTIHNSLQTGQDMVSNSMLSQYQKTILMNLARVGPECDVVFVHDPQPAGLVQKRGVDHLQDTQNSGNIPTTNKLYNTIWVWQCHIEINNPKKELWRFIYDQYVNKYDAVVFSAPYVGKQDLAILSFIIPPAIDPLSDKNRELSPRFVEEALEGLGVSD